MAIRGTKPKPLALRLVQERPDKLRASGALDSPVPKGDVGGPPRTIPAGAKRVWRQVIESIPPGMLTAADRPTLEHYCVAVALHEEARQKIGEWGFIVRNASGSPAINPLINIISRQALIAARLASELGLTPTARVRLTTTKPTGDEDDDYGL